MHSSGSKVYDCFSLSEKTQKYSSLLFVLKMPEEIMLSLSKSVKLGSNTCRIGTTN